LGQSSSMGVGADHAPFYENDDGAGPYAFQRYSDLFHAADSAFPDNTPVHDPALGRVNTDDFPDVSDGFRVDFETFIVFVDDQYRAEKKFDVLAGFSWAVYRMNNVLHLDGMGPNFSTIDAAHLMTLNNALADSLFADWTAETGLEVNTCVPEPSAAVLLAMGGLTLLVV